MITSGKALNCLELHSRIPAAYYSCSSAMVRFEFTEQKLTVNSRRCESTKVTQRLPLLEEPRKFVRGSGCCLVSLA